MQQNDSELAQIGRAYYYVKQRDIGEQDSRGWNKCLKAIWDKYLELANESTSPTTNS